MTNRVELCLMPGAEPISWAEFRRTHPPYSIALDGYVRGASQFDPRGPWLNFDHHADVDRLSSRATCSQVLLAVRQGLFEPGSLLHRQHLRVFVNDCDEDVCLSWYLVNNAERLLRWNHSHIDRLVQAVDVLDTTAGACLQPIDENLLREIAWIFEPYRTARLRGSLDTTQDVTHRGIVDAVYRRIDAHLSGSGGVSLLDLRYERILSGTGWTMVREIGAQARLGMVRDGIRAFISVRGRGDRRWTYAIGRTSPFVSFDVAGIVAALNRVEPPGQGQWGGGNLIAGSPRKRGSALPPAKVAAVVAEYLGKTLEPVATRNRLLLPPEPLPV
jgi:hypothetical protein